MRLGCRAWARNAMMHWPEAAYFAVLQLVCNRGAEPTWREHGQTDVDAE